MASQPTISSPANAQCKDAAEKKALQDAQYCFPYHYLAHFRGTAACNGRFLDWGWQYLTYMSYISEYARKLCPESILDVGCGDGFFLNNLGLDQTRLLGVDQNENSIAFARAFSSGAEFQARDVADLSEQFDLATSIEVLEHIPDQDIPGFVSAMAARIKPGGHLIVCVPTDVVPVSAKHFRHYNETLLAEQMQGQPLKQVEQVRLWKRTARLKLLLFLLHNKYWHLAHPWLRSFFWKRHQKRTFFATARNGAQLVTVYEKL